MIKQFTPGDRQSKFGQYGFSLIELMIVMIIVLVMSLAVFGVLSSSESKKRAMTTVNDANQAGNYAMYQLDKIVRQAGSGYGYSWQTSFGCELFASLNSSQILPYPSSMTMPAPFTSLNTTLNGVYRLAPIVIAYQATTGSTDSGGTAQPSDALIVMSGTAGYSEFPVSMTAITNATTLALSNYVGFNPSDLALIVSDTTSNGPTPCLIEEVDPAFAQSTATNLPLKGIYTSNPIGAEDITTLPISAVSAVMNIGNANPTNNNLPAFQMIGVGANNVLYSYDLLQGGASGNALNTSVLLADSVFEMHALYLLDTGVWVSPSAAPYDVATLEGGKPASQLTLSTIKAIRLGLIMRTNAAEQTAVTPGPVSLFADLASTLQINRSLKGNEQNYHYRTIEATIPLRNSIMLNSQ